jgi:hypothetical protein
MRITRDQLLEMDESRLRRDVLLPLFREMGFKDVFEYHGHAMEQGKDIVMWTADLAGTRINYVAVVKAKPISGQASGKGGAGDVLVQVHQSFGSAYIDPHGTEKRADRCLSCALIRLRRRPWRRSNQVLARRSFPRSRSFPAISSGSRSTHISLSAHWLAKLMICAAG